MFGAGTAAAAGGMAQNQTPELSMVEVAEDCTDDIQDKHQPTNEVAPAEGD